MEPQPNASDQPSPTAISGAWTRLADQVGQFCAAWEATPDPPDPGDFAPQDATAWRRRTLLELVKIDLEQRWTRDIQPWHVEEYLKRWPELREEDGSPPCELVYEEYHVRRGTSRPASFAELLTRFPVLETRLKRLLGGEATATHSLSVGRPPPELEVGTSVDDFDLLARLGRGTFATVYLARQRSLQRLVALKVSANKSQEAQTLAQLDHPGIVRVYDQRVLSDRGLKLLYMQYVPGAALSEVVERMRQRGPSPWLGQSLLDALAQCAGERGLALTGTSGIESSLRRRLESASWSEVVALLGVQLAVALDYAHRQGVLHRDLKPANVLLDEQGTPKLVDFNISFCSKLAGATPAAYFGGSLAYMSPEQLEACDPDHDREPEEVGVRGDFYSLGVLLWELLYGVRPFSDPHEQTNWSHVLRSTRAQREREPSPPARPGVSFQESGPLELALRRCLAVDPSARPESGIALARDLRFALETRAQEFFRPRQRSGRALALRWPLAWLATLILVANGLAGVFNYFYNKSQIVDALPDAGAAFWRVQFIINSVAFPLGLLIGALIVWPVVTGVNARPVGGAQAARIRLRCLEMGQALALLGSAEWILAGLLYPIALRWCGAGLTPPQQVHFFVSLALCGAIAATYPFFLTNWLAVRHFYPVLLGLEQATAPELVALQRLQRHCWWFLALAAALPLVGILLFVGLADRPARWILGTLSITGLFGFGGLLLLMRSLQGWLRILAEWLEISRDPALIRDDSFRREFFL